MPAFSLPGWAATVQNGPEDLVDDMSNAETTFDQIQTDAVDSSEHLVRNRGAYEAHIVENITTGAIE